MHSVNEIECFVESLLTFVKYSGTFNSQENRYGLKGAAYWKMAN